VLHHVQYRYNTDRGFMLSFWILVINISPRLVVIMSQKWFHCNAFF